MRRAARLDVRLEDHHLGAVLLRQRAARQATHARTNDDDIVLIVEVVARQAIARALVRRLFVARVDGHVIREGHHLIAFCVLDLLDVVASLSLNVHHAQLRERGGRMAVGHAQGGQGHEAERARREQEHAKM